MNYSCTICNFTVAFSLFDILSQRRAVPLFRRPCLFPTLAGCSRFCHCIVQKTMEQLCEETTDPFIGLHLDSGMWVQGKGGTAAWRNNRSLHLVALGFRDGCARTALMKSVFTDCFQPRLLLQQQSLLHCKRSVMEGLKYTLLAIGNDVSQHWIWCKRIHRPAVIVGRLIALRHHLHIPVIFVSSIQFELDIHRPLQVPSWSFGAIRIRLSVSYQALQICI